MEVLIIESTNHGIIKKLCDSSQFIDFGSHLGYIGTYHMIQDLLMPSTYAAVIALLKDTDTSQYDRL